MKRLVAICAVAVMCLGFVSFGAQASTTRTTPYDIGRLCLERTGLGPTGLTYQRDCTQDPPYWDDYAASPFSVVVGETARKGLLTLGGVGHVGLSSPVPTQLRTIYSARSYQAEAMITIQSGAGGPVSVTVSLSEESRVSESSLRDQFEVCLSLTEMGGSGLGSSCTVMTSIPAGATLTTTASALANKVLRAGISVSGMRSMNSEGFDGELAVRVNSFTYSVG